MDVQYGWEKFFSALRNAVASDATLQTRLERVMFETDPLRRDSFPDDGLWKRFEKLQKATTAVPAKSSEGNIRATTSKMPDDEAGKWLQEAFDIFNEFAEAYGRQNG